MKCDLVTIYFSWIARKINNNMLPGIYSGAQTLVYCLLLHFINKGVRETTLGVGCNGKIDEIYFLRIFYLQIQLIRGQID